MTIMKIDSTVSTIINGNEDGTLEFSDGKLTIQARGSEVHLNISKPNAIITAYITSEEELDKAIAILRLAKQKYHKYD